MRLKLSLVTGTEVDDLSVTLDASATVGQLSERLRVSHPRALSAAAPGPTLCLKVNPGRSDERSVPADATMGEAGIRSGDSITLTNSGHGRSVQQEVATLAVVSGPDAGKSFSLPHGTSIIGRDRDCDIRLSDPLVSKRHAKITVTDMIEVIDDNSANGVQVNDELVERAAVTSSDHVFMGDTELRFVLRTSSAAAPTGGGPTIEFNRSPRLDPRYLGVELIAPEPPDKPGPQKFPWITILAPLLMGAILYSVTKNIMSILFIALSPIMIVGAFFEGRHSSKKAIIAGSAQFRESLRALAIQLQYACDEERTIRRRENPSVDDVVDGAARMSPMLWTRRPEHETFAQVRLGLGKRPSRNKVKMPETNKTLPELWRELHDVVGQYSTVDRVPVVADLRECGNIGIGGPSISSHPLAASIIVQLAGLHSPAELVVGAVTSPSSSQRWEWLKWLPHAGSEYSPLECEHLASNANNVTQLVSALEGVLAARQADDNDKEKRPIPVVVVLVEDDAVIDRARLVQIAERGPSQGVHLIWTASSVERIPAACRTYLEVDPNNQNGRVGYVRTGEGVEPIELEPITEANMVTTARSMSPDVDAGAMMEDQSDVPRTVSFLALAGHEMASDPAEVIEHWRGHNSIPDPGAPKLKRDNTLKALVGQSASGHQYLDLRVDGPHALVGGTTGSGKSEFLQSWILGMAVAHSSARVNFLFIDYKGGAAFAECLNLPHCVGMVTDLSPHLVRRALRSLRAELRRREHILNAKKAKDLLELERRRDPEAPPSLVIIVDEFAALVTEVPEFVDGVVDVAQRGRSLGLHLILATQRPGGVIKDNLRANTNLRVALRVADEEHSTDVVGTPIAGTFDPSIPGRAVAKTGPGRLALFQSAYVGGHTTSTPPPPSIDVNEFRFGVGQPWDEPESSEETPREAGPSDISQIVDNVIAANDTLSLPPVRQPWLPELSSVYRLEDLPTPRDDEQLVYGVIDRPDDQAQPVVAFWPEKDGNMAVFGTGGSGKSAFLRTIAAAAAFAPARGGPCHVYALDFGARGLAMIEQLPHVGAVINGDDSERTYRLLKMLREMIDERATRYASVNAASVVEYRASSGKTDEPRILLLVDNFAAFRTAYELGINGKAFEMLESIVADGRAVGIHMVATADQSNAFTASLKSVIQSQLALRLASDMDMTSLGVPNDVFDETTPPGRGFADDSDIQVGILGGDPNVARQAEAMTRLAEAMRRAGVQDAPAIERLSDDIPGHSIDQKIGDEPVLGVWDESLQPLTFDPHGVFIVAGPPQSGKTATVATMLESLKKVNSRTHAVLFGPAGSVLATQSQWDRRLTDADEMATYCTELTAKMSTSDSDVLDLVIVLERVDDLIGGQAEDEVQSMIKAARNSGNLVIVEGEISAFNGNWGLMSAIKRDRAGIVLQPDQADGDTVFNIALPRVSRAEFPPGRGYYTRAGRIYRVQVLSPTTD